MSPRPPTSWTARHRPRTRLVAYCVHIRGYGCTPCQAAADIVALSGLGWTCPQAATASRRRQARAPLPTSELELQDIHLHGRAYTWSNERSSPTLVKLDRALASLDWEELHHSCFLQALFSESSDHSPLLLHTNAAMTVKPRFHFEIFRPKFDGYLDAVKHGWNCPGHIRDPFRRFDQLLRNTARALQSWSAKQIGNIKEQLLVAREVVLRLDRAQKHRQLSDSELTLRRQLKMQCLGLASLERTIARQRSRVLQIKEGDANTRYFHLVARGRRRRQFIATIRSGVNTFAG